MKKLLTLIPLLLLLATTKSLAIDCDSLSTSFTDSVMGSAFYGYGNATATGYFTTYRWDFGDGSAVAYGADVAHTYTADGTYSVSLLVIWSDALGDSCFRTAVSSVTIGSTTPPAFDCDSLSASLSDSMAGSTAHLYVSTTPGYTESYHWDYGDGTAGTATGDPTHTYSGTGTYTVSVTVTTTDGLGDSCVRTLTTVVDITGGTDCSTWYADFTDGVVGGTAGAEYFMATSSSAPAGYTSYDSWSFGDGTYASGTTTTHTYTTDGTYTVTLTTIWVSSTGDTCTHTGTHTVEISGTGTAGSALSGNIYGPGIGDSMSFYVWLIVYDSSTGTLTAIDSTTSFITSAGYRYEFAGVATGIYLTKAKLVSSVPGTTGWVPTYDTSSTYWGTATEHYHLAGTADGHVNIHMQYGTVPAGPGFIGGSITAGAGKATDAGVANMLVFLRDAADGIITYVYTDATGAYSFSSLAVGTYNVYPEAINYATTPSSTVVITTGTPIEGSINFRESTTLYTIKPITTGVNNVTANNAVKIFPNPANGTLHILWSTTDNNKHISITDVTGRQLISTNVENTSAQKDLDISALAKGIYIVHITSANVDMTQKLVVE